MHYADIKPNFYEAFRVAVAVFLKLNCENLNIALVRTHTHTLEEVVILKMISALL